MHLQAKGIVSVAQLDDISEAILPVFKKDGVYFVTVRHSRAGEPMEIALHGVLSEEQARTAAEALISPQPERAVSSVD